MIENEKNQVLHAAFGFHTEERIKPVHLATGFLRAVVRSYYQLETLNKTVALSSSGDREGDYSAESVFELLTNEKLITE